MGIMLQQIEKNLKEENTFLIEITLPAKYLHAIGQCYFIDNDKFMKIAKRL